MRRRSNFSYTCGAYHTTCSDATKRFIILRSRRTCVFSTFPLRSDRYKTNIMDCRGDAQIESSVSLHLPQERIVQHHCIRVYVGRLLFGFRSGSRAKRKLVGREKRSRRTRFRRTGSQQTHDTRIIIVYVIVVLYFVYYGL